MTPATSRARRKLVGVVGCKGRLCSSGLWSDEFDWRVGCSSALADISENELGKSTEVNPDVKKIFRSGNGSMQQCFFEG